MRCGPGKVPLALDTANPAAVNWARTRAAELVTNITKSTREAIREVVTQGFTDGIAPRDTAKLIREMVGLTERDAGAVMKRRKSLIAKGVKTDVAQARSEKYAGKLLRSRAEMIARTETMRASNEGQAQLWKQAQDQGLLKSTAKKQWLTADPCPICAPLDGETVGINESFSVGQDPPLHPRCKCTVGLVG